MGSIKLATTGKKPTKTVDTLVPDINKLLTGLANNKKLKISDKQLDEFLKNIKDAIVDWSNPVKQNKSSLRMSIIGRPARQLWYDKHRPEKQYTPDPSTQLKFLYGHILEHLILFLTEPITILFAFPEISTLCPKFSFTSLPSISSPT